MIRDAIPHETFMDIMKANSHNEFITIGSTANRFLKTITNDANNVKDILDETKLKTLSKEKRYLTKLKTISKAKRYLVPHSYREFPSFTWLGRELDSLEQVQCLPATASGICRKTEEHLAAAVDIWPTSCRRDSMKR
eukprot:sb/3474574/